MGREPLDELRAAVGSKGDEDVTIARWDAFHKSWLDASRMEAHLTARVATKQLRADVENERVAAAEAYASGADPNLNPNPDPDPDPNPNQVAQCYPYTYTKLQGVVSSLIERCPASY